LCLECTQKSSKACELSPCTLAVRRSSLIHYLPRFLGPFSRLGKDYDRYQKEPGNAPRLFHDAARSYPLPTEALPLDRCVESFIWTTRQRHAQAPPQAGAVSNSRHSQHYTNNSWTTPGSQPTHVGDAPEQSYEQHGWHSNVEQDMHGTQNLIPHAPNYYGEDTWAFVVCVAGIVVVCSLSTLHESQLIIGASSSRAANTTQYHAPEPPDRIRGGGGSTSPEDGSTCSDDRPTLRDVPVALWHNQLVSDPPFPRKS
jgi:hypothetical protein